MSLHALHDFWWEHNKETSTSFEPKFTWLSNAAWTSPPAQWLRFPGGHQLLSEISLSSRLSDMKSQRTLKGNNTRVSLDLRAISFCLVSTVAIFFNNQHTHVWQSFRSKDAKQRQVNLHLFLSSRSTQELISRLISALRREAELYKRTEVQAFCPFRGIICWVKSQEIKTSKSLTTTILLCF